MAKSTDSTDRISWQSQFFAAHPEVLELTERLFPLSRACSLAREYRPTADSSTDKEADEQALMSLIALHLNEQGWKHSSVLLGRQLGISFENAPIASPSGSRLVSILRLALQDSEKIWDLTISDKGVSAEQNTLELQDHLGRLGLLIEKIDRDANIWSEPAGNVIYDETASSSKNRQIKAASLNRLLLQLTSPDAADVTFLKTFLMTYRLFTTPITLLRKLIQRYDVPVGSTQDNTFSSQDSDAEEGSQSISAERRLAIQTRVCNVMKQWVADYFDIDFNNHTLRTELKGFIERLKQEGSPLGKPLENMLIRVSMGQKESPSSIITSRTGAPDPKVPNNIFSPNLKLTDVDEEEIARQLTLIEFQTFANIQPVELLNQAWGSKHLKHRAPYVTAMIGRFNLISNWVAHSILSMEKLRDRVRMYTRFIKMAEHLRNMNNFQTFQAILAALSSTPIHRLKLTQMTVDPRLMQKVEEWNDLMKGDQSYRQVRLALASIKPPAIPYIGIFLKDIVFIADGNPDLTAEGLINYNKYKLLYSVISQIQQFQQEAYNFHFVEQIAKLLQSFKFYDEDTLYSMSLRCEAKAQ